MKTKLKLSIGLLLLFMWSTTTIFSQTARLEKVITPVGFDKSKNLREVPIIPPGFRDRTWKNNTIKNKDNFLEEFNKPAEWSKEDPVLQKQIKEAQSDVVIDQNFAGVGNLNGVAPPDTDGDVGLNHYMQIVNLSFQIWDKSGNSIYGPADNSTLWDGFTGPWTGTNDGDPIVLYDEYSDRWIATQFSLPNYPNGPFYELIAVSETGDPTGSWYRYAYEFTNMPDYPKFGVWPDGYYFTINQFSPTSLNWAGAGVCVLDRVAMISGDADAEMLFFNLGTSYGSLLPADADGNVQPAEGAPNYLMNLGTNSVRIWEAEIDWTNTSNSSVNLVNTISTQPFSYSGITVNQPGTSQELDVLASRLMYRLQYRNFESYEVMLTNHTVNADGNGQAGVRWYEFRNYGSGWSIYQQGTFAPDDSDNRWMGSVAMNANGDIGLGYSVSGSSTYPSIRFTGQSASNSGTGILDVVETSILEGSSSQTGVDRWGDYSMISIDPSDDQTFWYTTEYSNGGWNWKTQIASLIFDTPVVTIPVAEFEADNLNPTTVELVNFTDLSENTPTSWLWEITPDTYSFSGSDDENSQNPSIIFNETGFYTISLTATNSEGSDTEIKTDYIEVSLAPPVADFEADNLSPTLGEIVNFTDLSIYDPISWLWEITPSTYSFSGGTDENSQNPIIIFNETGFYTISLTATNAGGSDTETKTNYIEVVQEAPIAEFEADNTNPTVDMPVTFTDLSINNPATWLWEFTPSTITFQSGTNNTTQNPIVAFDEVGFYSVSLTVTNTGGSDTEIKTDYVEVAENLSATASATPDEICSGETSQLNCIASGGTGSFTYSWTSNPEGFTSTEQNPIVTPDVTTIYSVEVSDGENSVSDDVEVVVNDLPEITLGNWPEILCNQLEPPVQLTADPTGGVYSGNVTDDGIFTPETSPLGWNVITYTYVDNNDCENSEQDSIYVDNCVGVENVLAKDFLNIFPNPNKGSFKIESAKVIKSVDIINPLGKVVYSRTYSKKRVNIDTNLSKGIFFIRIHLDDGSLITKEIIVD